jgi:putative ABC transport system permease protein
MRGSELNRDDPELFFRNLLDEGRAMAGVSAAALAYSIPLLDHGWRGPFTPEDLDPALGDQGVYVNINAVSEGFFSIMGIPVMEGRALEEEDVWGEPSAVAVNQAFARSYWPGVEHVVGRTIREAQGQDASTYRVVALVGDVRPTPGSGAEPVIYSPLSHLPDFGVGMNLLVRGGEDPNELAAPLRGLIHRLDPSLPVPEFTTLDRLFQDSLMGPRFYAAIATGLALLALSLALAGVYGTTSYLTSRRTGEIGIRMALGADRFRVVEEILHASSRAALTGIALGLAGGWLGSRHLESMLFGIEPMDVPTYVVVALGIGTAVTMAAFVPARRASGIDPAETIREETGR